MSYRHESRSSLIRGDSDPYATYSGGGYNGREGLIPQINPIARPSRKMYRPNSTWTWTFMITAIVQAVIVLAIECYVFAKFQENVAPGVPPSAYSKTIPTYLTLFIFGFLYQLILVYDSLRLKNTIQVIGLCAYNGGMLIYASLQVDQIKKVIIQLESQKPVGLKANTTLWTDIQPFLVAVPCIIAFFCLVMSFIAWKLYDEFAWTIYKQISADLRMKRRFLAYQIYIALLKFDFFFFLGFTVQFLVIVTGLADAEMGLTIAAIPITVLILSMAGFFTRRENKPGMLLIIFLYFCAMAYFIFKLARMYGKAKYKDYLPVRKSLTSFAVITLVLIVLTIANAVVCMRNFGKGLKMHIMKRKTGGSEGIKTMDVTELPDLKPGQELVPTRMTID